jgi:hypothetical protein
MSSSPALSVTGTIRTGDMAGYRVRVEDDFQNTGGYLICFWSESEPNIGGDHWVEYYDHLLAALRDLDWNVTWDEPLEKLRR